MKSGTDYLFIYLFIFSRRTQFYAVPVNLVPFNEEELIKVLRIVRLTDEKCTAKRPSNEGVFIMRCENNAKKIVTLTALVYAILSTCI